MYISEENVQRKRRHEHLMGTNSSYNMGWKKGYTDQINAQQYELGYNKGFYSGIFLTLVLIGVWMFFKFYSLTGG